MRILRFVKLCVEWLAGGVWGQIISVAKRFVHYAVDVRCLSWGRDGLRFVKRFVSIMTTRFFVGRRFFGACCFD